MGKVVAIADLTEQAFCRGIEPETDLTVTEWADAYRVLSSRSSAEPGRWRTERTPYLREIMDCLSTQNDTQRIVVMAGAQVGKTECGNNWIGYVISRAPAPMLMVQPTIAMAQRVMRQRIAPMIEGTSILRGKVSDLRTKDQQNTKFTKEFDGGILMVSGANSSAGLRSMPIRYVFLDEVDEYPGDLEGQGDPVALAEKRTDTFARRKILLTSTPTVSGVSRIEKEYLVSDQRKYYIPCPLCGHMDYLQWSPGGRKGNEGHHHHIVFDNNDPTTAAMRCASCGKRVVEGYKSAMLARGEWRATAKGDGKTAGFHLSALYSPLGWKSWRTCVEDFLRAKDDPFLLKAWVNTTLGEAYEERGQSVDAGALRARVERYNNEVPSGVGALVAAVDVQNDRLEVAVKGYGAGEESWLIAFTQIFGDPATTHPWEELDRFIGRKFEHESGHSLSVVSTVVDTGGHHTEHVYRYCKARQAKRVFAIKGSSVSGRPLVERPSTGNRYRVPLFVLCVDTGKDMIMSRLLMTGSGPGRIHLPDWVDDEYLAQLTSEKSLRRYVKGRGAVREWVKLRERNEALDLEVYALAALYICGAEFVKSLGERASTFMQEPREPAPPEPLAGVRVELPNGVRVKPRASGGWMNWRV